MAEVLQENKNLAREHYRGDSDAPNVSIVPVPKLGLSMELQANDTVFWDTLSIVARDIAARTDYYVTA